MNKDWILKRIKTWGPPSDNPLRSSNGANIYGFFHEAPKVGQRFDFFSDPLTPGTVLRRITTSMVVEIYVADDHEYRFITENSRWMLFRTGRLTVPLLEERA